MQISLPLSLSLSLSLPVVRAPGGAPRRSLSGARMVLFPGWLSQARSLGCGFAGWWMGTLGISSIMRVTNQMTRHLAAVRESQSQSLPPFTCAWLSPVTLTLRALGRNHTVPATSEGIVVLNKVFFPRCPFSSLPPLSLTLSLSLSLSLSRSPLSRGKMGKRQRHNLAQHTQLLPPRI